MPTSPRTTVSIRPTWIVLAVAVIIAAALAPLVPARSDAQGQLPPGHPPSGGPRTAPSVPSPPPGSGTGAQSLTWTAPAGWTKETPSSGMRRAQYRIPGPGGAAECVVFYFGPGQGGDAKANVERWVGQFRRADGQPVADAKTRETKVGDLAVMMVEVTGTYVGGMGGAASGGERPDAMLLGAVVQGPDANWFFRATGPRKTLENERAAFERMIRSVKRGAAGA